MAIDARPLDIAYLRAQGLGRYAQGLLGPLAARVDDLVAFRSRRRAAGPFGLDAAPGQAERTLRRPPLPGPLADLAEHLLLPVDLRRCGADLVHNLSIYRGAAAPGIPSVVTVHDVAPLMWPEHYLRTGAGAPAPVRGRQAGGRRAGHLGRRRPPTWPPTWASRRSGS